MNDPRIYDDEDLDNAYAIGLVAGRLVGQVEMSARFGGIDPAEGRRLVRDAATVFARGGAAYAERWRDMLFEALDEATAGVRPEDSTLAQMARDMDEIARRRPGGGEADDAPQGG